MKGLELLGWVVINAYCRDDSCVAGGSKAKQKNTGGLIFWPKKHRWFMLGASIFASNGSEHVRQGLAGTWAGTNAILT